MAYVYLCISSVKLSSYSTKSSHCCASHFRILGSLDLSVLAPMSFSFSVPAAPLLSRCTDNLQPQILSCRQCGTVAHTLPIQSKIGLPSPRIADIRLILLTRVNMQTGSTARIGHVIKHFSDYLLSRHQLNLLNTSLAMNTWNKKKTDKSLQEKKFCM